MTYLARPEGDERAEGVARLRLEAAHLAERGEHGDGEGARGARLDLDLSHLERAERDVGEDLGARGAREPDGGLVLGSQLLPGEVHVRVLEELVEAVLEHALERVADEGRAEALPEALGALLREDRAETGEKALVLARAYLWESNSQLAL